MTGPTLVVAEDEATLRVELVSRLRALWPEAGSIIEAANGLEALDAVEAHAPDVLFVDLRMPELDGLGVANQVAGRCHVVFVTAHEEAAVGAFEAGALDYLLKPVSDERLSAAITRVKSRLGQPAVDLGQVLAKLVAPAPTLRWVQASNGRAIEFVATTEVAFFQAEEKYTTVRTAQRELLIRTPLRELLVQLDPARFWQIHRSTIVNVDFIEQVVRLESGELEVRVRGLSEVSLAVSRSFRHRFKYM